MAEKETKHRMKAGHDELVRHGGSVVQTRKEKSPASVRNKPSRGNPSRLKTHITLLMFAMQGGSILVSDRHHSPTEVKISTGPIFVQSPSVMISCGNTEKQTADEPPACHVDGAQADRLNLLRLFGTGETLPSQRENQVKEELLAR